MTIETSTQPAPPTTSPVISPIRIPDFRLLWVGATAVSLGVQFYSVGLVWLVLYLTGSGLQLGTLLTVAAIPRAISMLLSGALIDRYPPRLILTISALFNGILMSVVLLLLGNGWMSMTALFIVAPITGLMDAVFYPTNTALIPRLVDKTQLAPANALIQTADTIANIAGPALGGILIGEVGRLAGAPEAGLLAGFALNSLLFLGGFLVFLNLSRKTDTIFASTEEKSEPLGKAVLSGIRYALTKPPIRISLLMISLLNFAAIGPIVVGGALLVERRFLGDATMYGFMTGAFGIGSLVGAFGISLMGKNKRPGMTLIYAAFALAVGLVVLGFAPTFWVAFGVCFMIGIFGSITGINATTWLQLKTDPHMQGRMASLTVFAAVALDPFSNAISGAVADLDVTLLFCAAGALVGIGGIAALFNPTLREEIQPSETSQP